MNTNSNTYTVIYSTVLVVVVAAVLAFAAMYLKPKQDENVKKDTISQILTAADINVAEGADVLKIYQENLDTVLVFKVDGTEWNKEDLVKDKAFISKEDCSVYDNSMLKKQMTADKGAKKLPVYIFKNGITVIPCYGAGLWGPVWGYIGLDGDLNTIKKACFGHKGETPGLGAKITDEPAVFADKFTNKRVGSGGVFFTVAKNITDDNLNAVNAISGATITSQAVGKAVNQWFGFYQEYFKKYGVKAECEQPEAQVIPEQAESTDTEGAAPVVETKAATVTPAEPVNE